MSDPSFPNDSSTPSLTLEQRRSLISEFRQSFRQTLLGVTSFPERFENIVQRNQVLNDMADQVVSLISLVSRLFDSADPSPVGNHYRSLSLVTPYSFRGRCFRNSQYFPVFRRLSVVREHSGRPEVPPGISRLI